MTIGESVYLKTPIRAVKYFNDILFWGEGYTLHYGDKTIRVPASERIIKLESGLNGSLFIITEFRLFLFKDDQITPVPLSGRDRILTILHEGTKLFVVQARGTVQLFHDLQLVKMFSFVDFSAVFYSASIVRKVSDSTIEIAFGTIFSGILLAEICESETFITGKESLNGHRGTIFDIRHHPNNQNFLVSCSDDRSIRIWNREEAGFLEVAVCCDHEARVWGIDIQGDLIASVSEDNTCKLWNLKGGLERTIEGDSHSKSLWTVSLNTSANTIALGSNDGSVITHNLSESTRCLLEAFLLPEEFGLIKNFVVTSDGTCYAATDKQKIVKICKNAVSSSIELQGINKFPAMAVNSSHLFIADDFGGFYAQNLSVNDWNLCKLPLETGKKITKIFAQDDFLLLETLNGEFYLYNQKSDTIKLIKMEKRFKVTSFNCFEDEIFIGTRQGILFVVNFCFGNKFAFQLTDQESLKSIKIENEIVSIYDRSGFEIILNRADQFKRIKSTKIGKGTLECHIGNDFFSTFYQQNFIINHKDCGVVEKINCGGGHRLWSFAYNPHDFAFAFMSNGKLSVYKGVLDRVKMVTSRSHGKEIRCARLIKNNLILSGSEDGLLVLRDGLTPVFEVRLLNTSIKCLTITDDFVFIGGSNETIEAFKFQSDNNFLIHISSCLKQIESIETRVLSLDSLKLDGRIYLIAGYSDASIRLFEFDLIGNIFNNFKLLSCLKNVHKGRCVQQLRFISNNCIKFISAGADGLIQAWIYQNNEIKLFWNRVVHDSGINAIDICQQNDEKSLSILTGGEDGTISLMSVFNDKIENVDSFKSHNSTVTGVKFLSSNRFISASIDRFLILHSNQQELQVKRTVISDISAMELASNYLNVYGAGMEIFKLE